MHSEQGLQKEKTHCDDKIELFQENPLISQTNALDVPACNRTREKHSEGSTGEKPHRGSKIRSRNKIESMFGVHDVQRRKGKKSVQNHMMCAKKWRL